MTWIFNRDPVELQNRIGDLQFQNRRLTEENSKLQHQIDSQEEALGHASAEISNLNRKIKGLVK